MALTNKLVKQVDLPVWEWMRFLPAAAGATTLAGSALCTVDDGTARCMYYVTTTAAPGAFWRYDTWSDTWHQLASPNTLPSTSAGLKYSAYSGYRGNVLGATSTTATIPGLKGQVFKGYTIRILTGTGAGQDRTVSAVADAVVADQGFFSAVPSANQSTDGLKKWKYNQWAGYQCRLTYFTGQTQVRKILYNDATSLYFSDTNWQQLNSWGNTGWSAASPYALPVAQTGYVIESNVLTVGSSWSVTPDATSTFVIMSGGIWLVSTAGTPGWSSMQYYDIASDTWYNKTAIDANLVAALGTDWQLERTGEIGGTYASGTASAGAVRTLTDSTATWTVDQWVGYQVRITAGTGAGQRRRVTGNTATVLTVERNYDVTPDNTSVYSLWGDTDKLWLAGNANATLHQYSVEQDIWTTSAIMDWGTARSGGVVVPSGSAGYPNQTEGIAITSIVRTTTGILTVAVNAGGTSYAIGDIVHCTTGGTNGRARVTNQAAGVVTALELLQSGSGYSAGSSATTADTGSGSGLTITLTVGTVGLITTAIAHGLNTGASIKLSGALTDTSWNATFTILGVDSVTAAGTTAATLISINGSGTTASPTYTAHSTTTMLDSTKNWNTNEHAGRILAIYGVGIAPAIAATQFTRITSNTSNTITMLTSVSAVNGTSRYAIIDASCFGRDEQYRVPTLSNHGYATSGSSSSLTDSTKNWISNQWVGYKVRVIAGTGLGNENAITANTATSLTVGSWSNATPDSTSRYIIMDTFGISTSGSTTTLVDTTKNWPVNYWTNKRVRFTGGTNFGNEVTISSNTATQLTFGAITAITTTTSYTILNPPASGTNGSLQWIFGGSVTANKGKYMIKARGNSNQLDLYNITTETWDNTIFTGPQTENFVVGSMFAYDSVDRLYYTIGITGRVGYFDIPTLTQNGFGLTPYAHSTALAGNRMEIVTTADGLQYLYIMRHTGQEMWRMLIVF